jgi:hypothetical protein
MIEPVQYAQTTVVATSIKNPLTSAVISAFEDAMAFRGRLKDDAFRVQGFSGQKFRMFLNNLVNEVPAPRYLEIGLFHGASFCPAIYRNSVRAVGIDNWSEYGGNPKNFYDNLSKFRNENAIVDIIETDFRKVDFPNLGKFNILFYDGSHEEKDQYDGVALPQPAMDSDFILIVDDWNWQFVRNETFNAIRAEKIRVEYQIEVRTTFNNEHLPFVNGSASEWHNGCLIAVAAKDR